MAIPGATFDILEQELHVAAPYITAFGAIFMYVYAFGQLIMGVLVDRYGGYRVMLGGCTLLAIGGLLFPITSNLPIMYLSRGLIGFGASSFYLSLIKELKNIYADKDFGIAIAIMLFIGYTGGIFANAPFVYLMRYTSWREILFIIAIILIIATVIFSIILALIPQTPINKYVVLRPTPFQIVLHKPHNRYLFTFACCNFGISYVIQAIIGKKFIEDFCLYSTSKAAMILSIIAIVSAFFNIINASVCKFLNNKRVIFLKYASVVTFLSLLLICIFIMFDIKTIMIAIILCIVAANASLSSLLIPVLHQTNCSRVSGTAVSIMNFCFFMMVGILGTLTGFILKVFEPIRRGDTLVYTNNSYLLLFGTFLLLSVYEMYRAMKLSNKY
ncbi:MAG: MFS transporter [bacterium]|nr:MFS transporter [bacterium]